MRRLVLLWCVLLSACVTTGSTTWTRPLSAQELRLTKATRILEHIGDGMKAVQELEISCHEAKRVADTDHQLFQAHLLAWADAIESLRPALVNSETFSGAMRQAISVTGRMIGLALKAIHDEGVRLALEIKLQYVSGLLVVLESVLD